MNSIHIITGEKLQEIADIYIGEQSDFNFNPRIRCQYNKQLLLSNIPAIFQNPSIIFCYADRINNISKIISTKFQNPFILISHNSDNNIIETPNNLSILENPLLIKWYAQNNCFRHPKLELAPIGLANSMWPHGNLSIFDNKYFIDQIYNNTSKVKPNHIFFNFNIHTNPKIRQPCYDILSRILPFLPNISPLENLIRLSTYQFCISPEGNGSDCHRLWEAFYLKVVPIVLNTPFTETLVRNKLPVVVLEKWEDILEVGPTLKYSDYDFSIIQEKYTFTNFSQLIRNITIK
jgi:hypothetical protein